MKEAVVFRNRNFMSLWTSQALSQVALNIITFLVLVRVFEMTGSTIATSFVWIAYALPALIIGPFASASADIFDKRKVLVYSNLTQALIVLLYAIFFEVSLFVSYLVVFSYSFFNQFYIPTESSALPSLVKKDTYPIANSIFFFTAQIAVVAGFGVGGAINELVNFQAAFLLGAAFLFIAFLSVMSLPEMKAERKLSQGIEKGVGVFFNSISEGYFFIKGHRHILMPFALMIGLQVSVSVLGTVLPIMSTDILMAAAASAGFLIALPAGLGAGAGGLISSRLLMKKIRKRKIIEVSLLFLTLEIWAVIFLVSRIGPEVLRIAVSWALFFAAGVSFGSIFLSSQTFLQEQTPGGMRGRVFGNFWFLGIVATVVPVLSAATIAELFGVRTLLFVLSLTSGTALAYSSLYGKKNKLEI